MFNILLCFRCLVLVRLAPLIYVVICKIISNKHIMFSGTVCEIISTKHIMFSGTVCEIISTKHIMFSGTVCANITM